MADPTIVFADADAVLGNYYLTATSGNRLTTNERPGAFRTTVAELAQNADLPLTGITNMLAQEKVNDYKFTWWERATPLRSGDATVCTDNTLVTEYAAGHGAVAAGTLIYAKVTIAVGKNFRPKQTVMTSKVTPVDDCVGIVEAVTPFNATHWMIIIKTLEASTAGAFNAVDKLMVISNANEQGSFIPDPVMYKKAEHYNYLQILRNPFQLSRTARNTALRTGDPYADLRRENLLLHGLDWEQSLVWGVPSWTDNTPNGEPMTTTAGINYTLEANAPQNVYDFYNAVAGTTTGITEWDGYSWEAKGDHFMDNALRQMFVYGSNTKVALCGSGAMYGLNRIAKAWGTINMQVGATSFGLAVVRWVTPFGTLFLKQHPLFTQKPGWNNSVLVIEPASLKIRVMLDTDLFTDDGETKAGLTAYDGKKEEYRAELGLEMHNAEKFFRLDGVGMNNVNYVP